MPSVRRDRLGRDGTVAYAILAHTDQEQLMRLIRVLRTESPACSVVVHWDASKEPLAMPELEAWENVHLVSDAIAIEWGGFSLVDATLRMIRTALDLTSCNWIVLLSGHDYPVAPVAEIEQSLRACNADAHIDIGQIVPSRAGVRWSRTYAGWLSRRYYFSYVPLPHFDMRVHPIIRKVAAKVAFRMSKCQPFVMFWPMPPGVRWRLGIRRVRTPFGPTRACRSGSQWMTLSRKGAERVLARVARESELVAHFRRTVIPDEAFFQTILCAEPDLVVADGNRRYEQWRGAAPSHPENLGLADVASAVGSGMHFARKVVQRTDPSILDEIDRHRLPRKLPVEL